MRLDWDWVAIQPAVDNKHFLDNWAQCVRQSNSWFAPPGVCSDPLTPEQISDLASLVEGHLHDISFGIPINSTTERDIRGALLGINWFLANGRDLTVRTTNGDYLVLGEEIGFVFVGFVGSGLKVALDYLPGR